jgi:hypothetical protein
MKRQRLSEASAKPAVDAETIPTALPIVVSSTLEQGGTFDDGSRLSGGGSGSRDKGGKCSDITVEVALTNPVPAMLLTDEELAEMDCSSDVLHREIRLIHEEVFVEEQCVLHHPCTFGRDRAPSSISSAMATMLGRHVRISVAIRHAAEADADGEKLANVGLECSSIAACAACAFLCVLNRLRSSQHKQQTMTGTSVEG